MLLTDVDTDEDVTRWDDGGNVLIEGQNGTSCLTLAGSEERSTTSLGGVARARS